jgi:hypothetical protein
MEPTPMTNTTNPGERGRFSSQRKTTTVLRLLRGESLELDSREMGVAALIGRHGYRTPAQVRRGYSGSASAVA